MTAAARISIGAVVAIQLDAVRKRDGVVTEVVQPGRAPRAAVQGAGLPTTCVRYVITGDGYRVVRMCHQIGILLP